MGDRLADCAQLAYPPTALPNSFCIPRRDAVALLCNAQSSLAPVLSLLLRLYNVLVLWLEHSRRTEQMTWTGGGSGRDGQAEGVQLRIGGTSPEPEDEPPAGEPVKRLGHLGHERR